MIRLRSALTLLIVAAVPVAVLAQAPRDVTVIFKDGFAIKARVGENVGEVIIDKVSGRPFPIMSGKFFLDDHVRSILFSHSQVSKIVQFKPGEVKEPMAIVRIPRISQPYPAYETWEYTGYGTWNEMGERTAQVKSVKGDLPPLNQKIAVLTTHHFLAVTERYKWDPMYFTQEFDPELVRKILLQVFSEKKDLKDLKAAEKFARIAAFMQEAGWFKEAEKELTFVIDNFPVDKKVAEGMRDKLRATRADLFVEGIDKAASVGQHQEAMERLSTFAAGNYAKLASPANSRIAQDLKEKYDKTKSDIAEAKGFLKQMPALTKSVRDWTKACEFIADELNVDTLDRLDEFLTSARQFELERKRKGALSQSAEEVLATAVSGWLQGKQAALPDTKAALKLIAARTFLREYLKTDNQFQRANLLSSFKRDVDLPVDVMARLIRMTPPTEAHDLKKLDTSVQTIAFDLADGGAGSYLVQLPPDYHHQRAYPVLVVLHSGRENADDTLKRFSEEAAKQGFILVAPMWAGNKRFKARVQPGGKEHALVIDSLRDLRRRFQVDSDRVFLFGWEEGANMVYDIGLGHPDLFAGVVPMNGSLPLFTRRFYWSNAQFLPFYVIEGDRNVASTKATRDLFTKEWTRDPFACLYVEYRGRGSEWFSREVPFMMDWMSRKKRYTPKRELGRTGFGGTLEQEFRSTRSNEKCFYWLRADEIEQRCQEDHTVLKWGKLRPATFQANLSVGNKSKKDEKDIWNQINVRVSGMKQITFLITPEMTMNLDLPLVVILNGQQIGGRRKVAPSLDTLLEELYQSGDRQRLFVAKVDLKL